MDHNARAARPALAARRQLQYAIRPSHVLQIDYETGPTQSTTLILYIVYDGHRWRQVMGCPTAEAIAEARTAREIESRRADRVRALAASTNPELRDAVRQLYRQGRRVEAYKHYERVSGTDLSTARAVVELLAAPPGED